MLDFLDSITLQKLVDEQLAKGMSRSKASRPPSVPFPVRRWSSRFGQRAQFGVCPGRID
jgi:hypothetical protein